MGSLLFFGHFREKNHESPDMLYETRVSLSADLPENARISFLSLMLFIVN
jgi:hypothetical protein